MVLVIAGYALAMIMGLTLGLIGAGGSILTVPIFVYLLNVKPITATAYSLLVVGCTALVGSINYWRNGKVYFKEAVTFAVPSMSSVWLTRTFIVPALPPFILGFAKDSLIMVLFALMMIIAGLSMLITRTHIEPQTSSIPMIHKGAKLIFGSVLVGFFTGMVGAGGGFLIMPSLIAIFGFNIKEAIGTSLVIIAINSLVGFNGDLRLGLSIDWYLVGFFLVLTLVGVILGSVVSRQLDNKRLKQLFAVFILILGLYLCCLEMRVFSQTAFLF